MNRIILTFNNQELTQIEAPIQEDFTIEATTEFTSFADMAGSISTLVDAANIVSTTGGTVSRSGLMLRSIIDAQHWSKTNPAKINLDMFFYTKTNPLTDVVQKVNQLLRMHLLRVDPKTNKVLVPGINANMVAQIEKEIKKAKPQTNKEIAESTAKDNYTRLKQTSSSFFSVTIPGVIYLENAFMFAVKPTYSKQITENGFPLWAQVNVDICGIAPAFAEDFERGASLNYQSRGIKEIKKIKEQNYSNKTSVIA